LNALCPDTLPPEIALGRKPDAIPGNPLVSNGPTDANVDELVAKAGTNSSEAE